MSRVSRKQNPIQPAAAPVQSRQRIYNTAGYCRLSIEDSGHPGADTLSVQEELVGRFIESQPDMRFCGQYSDNGHTGTNFERPAFESLMAAVKTGKIDCIVVKDLSRFGRNYLETGNYLEHVFPFLDVRFVAVNDNFDTLTAQRSSDGYIVPLKNIVNEVFSKDISRKIIPALNAMREKGQFTGSYAPYGYRLCKDDCHRLEPDEETSEIVKEIFQLRVEGVSLHEIVYRLNQRGTPSPARMRYLRGESKSERSARAKWGISAIKLILSQEVYLGHMVQGRKRSCLYQGQKQINVPKEEWCIVRNTHTPVIDEATFAAVQQLTAERRSAYNEKQGNRDCFESTPNILQGLVFCADCKRSLRRVKKLNYYRTELVYYYTCPSHLDGSTSCTSKYTHEKPLLEILRDAIHREISLAESVEELAGKYRKSPKALSAEKEKQQEITAARQKLARARKLYDSLYESYIDKLMTEQEYMELKRQYRAEMEQAQASLELLLQQQKALAQQVEENPWLKAFRHFDKAAELNAEMTHALIERVEIDSDRHIHLTLKYRDAFKALMETLQAAGMET